MSQDVAEYTPLESLFLFQSLLSNGIDAAAFSRTSNTLRENPLIKADAKYDPKRLAPEALRQLFLGLLGEELQATEGGSTPENADGSLSPNSKKRKLEARPLPTLKDVFENVDKIPALVDRLYARYRDNVVKHVREDEARYDKVQKEIQLLERNERERLARVAANANGSPALAPKDTKQPLARHVASPASTTTAFSKPQTGNTPVIPPRSGPGGVASPSHLAQTAAAGRLSPAPKPSNGAPSALHVPSGATQAKVGMVQSPGMRQPPRQSISPRPDATVNNRATPQKPPPPPGAPSSGPLKWERPYQPAQGAGQASGSHLQPLAPNTGLVSGTPQQHKQQLQLQQQKMQQGQSPTATPSRPVKPGSATPHPPALQASSTGPGAASPQVRPNVPTPAETPRPTPPGAVPSQSSQPPIPPKAATPRLIAAAATPKPPSPGPPAKAPAFSPPPRTSQSVQAPPPPSATSIKSQQKEPGEAGIQTPRPPIKDQLIRPPAPTPAPKRIAIPARDPQTPMSTASPGSLMRGFGTRWQSTSTPSTPRPLAVEPESPAFEPVSPPSQALSLPREIRGAALKQSPATIPHKAEPHAAKNTLRSSRTSRSAQKRGASATPSVSETQRSQSVVSQTEERSQNGRADHDEPTTPGLEGARSESGTAAENAQPSLSRGSKRKRQLSLPGSDAPPNHVLWTRGFTKVSSSALDQISSHRDANMFATALRERDAPNYRQVVLQPQDITSIRAAIKQGNKAAIQAATSLEGGDPGTASVWLPISEDLTPPKGIINSAQLERELVHMFCNAIMYNPDPDRGPGPSFLKRSANEEEGVVGYRLDEHGVVKNTQAMFREVEKLLADLRSAEKERGAPPLAASSGAVRSGSALATPAEETADDEEEKDMHEGGNAPGTKRRRMTTRG